MTHSHTNADFFSLRNHASNHCVAIDGLVAQFTTLLVGDRESTSGLGDDGVEMLRRDMRRERNKAVRTILRVIRADLHKGKNADDIAAFSDALSAMIRSHSRMCVGSLEEAISGETDIECLENPLEVRVLRGDESRATLQKLGRTVRHHIQKLQGIDQSINSRLYGDNS